RVSFGCELPLRIFSERLVMCNGNLCRLVQLLLDGLVGHMRDSLSTANTGPGSVFKWYHTGIDSVFSRICKGLEILRINDRHTGIDSDNTFNASEHLIVPVERFIAFDQLYDFSFYFVDIFLIDIYHFFTDLQDHLPCVLPV